MTNRKIQKILIANRGEIACRIIRTCQELGIKSLVVASEADKNLPMVMLADEAVIIGPASAKESYLDIKKIVEVAQKFNVDAVHPGYGFLSENADFAEALNAAGIIFIGPSAQAIRSMGSKSEAKAIAEQVKANVIPGYRGAQQDYESLFVHAAQVGYPLLIKATHGGGGKGMRRVDKEEDFAAALAACQREAMSAFSNDQVMLEKLIDKPRHIEVQIFGDHHGNVISLSERDCSLQRRHQKIIEEAPAAGLSESVKKALSSTAIKIAKAVNYVGAGTVEFLVDADENYYFLEMNTRLQVEHPVTEMITGIDLVALQIQVAQGAPLPLTQEEVMVTGHAIEARLYAEDPANNFLPSIGALRKFLPAKGDGIRCDVGYQQGNNITIHYDPMLAKIIVFAKDRKVALQQLRRAVIDFEVAGVKTNRQFLLELLSDPNVTESLPDISYLDRLLAAPVNLEKAQESIVVAAFLLLLQQRPSGNSPWDLKDGWRHANLRHLIINLKCGDSNHSVSFVKYPSHYEVCYLGVIFNVELVAYEQRQLTVLINNSQHQVAILYADDNSVEIFHQEKVLFAECQDLDHYQEELSVNDQQLNAPMPGRVISVIAKAGEEIAQGAPILILEAMKMEHTIRAPYQGVLEKIFYNTGDFVDEGAQLAKVKAA